jgi:hypothetical protein
VICPAHSRTKWHGWTPSYTYCWNWAYSSWAM